MRVFKGQVFNLFRVLTILVTSMLIAYITSCGDDDVEIEIQEDVVANFVSVIPPSGDTIASNTTLTLAFDNTPIDFKSSIGNVTVAGKTVSIKGPFKSDHLEITITWADGTIQLFYTVSAPCAVEDGGCI